MNQVRDLTVAKKLTSLAHSAESRELEFNLSFNKVRKLIKQEKCFYTGVIMNDTPNSPEQRTIDRIDNTKGYTDDNVCACTLLINQAKGSLTIGQIKLIYNKIKHL